MSCCAAWRRAASDAWSTSPPTPDGSAPRGRRSIPPARAALTKTLARELVGKGVILNTICPGPTDTAILRSFLEGPDGARIAEGLKRAIPMRRLGAPEDYPGLIAFLLSDDAAYITGQTISVSGGLTMHG